MKSYLSFLCAIFFVLNATSFAGENAELHAPFDQLLQKYVKDGLVEYKSFHKNESDLNQLDTYVTALENADTSSMSRNEQLAFWINMYNAVTLKLILDNYPVESIKDIGLPFFGPWKKSLITFHGDKISLDEVENAIIRPLFNEARIHFALNCASIGCPQLYKNAFVAEKLDAQLDEVTKSALQKPLWFKVEKGKIYLTKLFSWYEEDFVEAEGSVRQFVAKYNPDQAELVRNEKMDIEHMDYNWKLNEVK